MSTKPNHLRNRANASDRPRHAGDLRYVPMKDAAGRACKEAGGHEHIFEPKDNYGCCTRCGDEVLV